MANKSMTGHVKCSFCGKKQEQVRKLIAGPEGVYICDECIDICEDMIAEEFDEDFGEPKIESPDINLLKPIQIKEFLDDYVIGQELAKKAAPFIPDGQITCQKGPFRCRIQSLQESNLCK